jgi:hypothetical protein
MIRQRPALSDLFTPAPIAFVLVVMFASIIASNSSVDFWIYATSPLSGRYLRDNSVIAYSWILDGRIFHKENLPSLDILNSFLVGSPSANIYAVRPVYPFLASVIAPLTGAMPALLLVNVAAWGLAAYCAVRLTNLLTDSALAPWIAVTFIVLGQGYWFHLTDYSAHMLSNCGYVVSVYVLTKIGVAERPLDLSRQVVAAAVLAAMALTYNTGLALLLAYMLFGILSGSWRASVITALLVVVVQRAWPFFYGWSGEFGAAIQGTESQYLAKALSRWWSYAQDPSLLFSKLGWMIVQIVASDPLNLAVVLICIVGIMAGLIKRRLEWFLFVAGIAPILTALPWMTFAPARGYIANAGYGVLAVLAATILGRYGRAAKLVTVCLVIVQGGWLASASLGNVYPAMIFSIGADGIGEFFDGFGEGTSTTASLTGYEAAPQRVGGHENASKAGGLEKTLDYVLGVRPANPTATLHAWAYRFYIFAPLMIATIFFVRRRMTAAVLMAVAYLLPPIIAQARAPERFNLVVTEAVLPAPAKLVTQEVTLSKQAWEAIQRASSSRGQVELFSGILAHAKLEAELCGHRIVDAIQNITSDDPNVRLRVHKVDLDALGRAVEVANCDRVLRLRIQGFEPSSVTSWVAWQKAGLPRRRLTIDEREVSGDERMSWPALELRLRSALWPSGQLETTSLFF